VCVFCLYEAALQSSWLRVPPVFALCIHASQQGAGVSSWYVEAAWQVPECHFMPQ
jgi:hypothetical protein